MKSRDLWQVVIDPREVDVTNELEEAVQRAVEAGEPMHISRRTAVRLYLADLLHHVGIHHWVQYRTYDPVSARIIVWPNYWVCAKCPKGKLG